MQDVKVEEKMHFAETTEIIAKRVVNTLKEVEREGRVYYRQFVNLVKDESVYRKVLRCVKYGDKVPRKHMRKYGLVVKNLKKMIKYVRKTEV